MQEWKTRILVEDLNTGEDLEITGMIPEIVIPSIMVNGARFRIKGRDARIGPTLEIDMEAKTITLRGEVY